MKIPHLSPRVCLTHLEIPAVPGLLFFMLLFQLKLTDACTRQRRRTGGKKKEADETKGRALFDDPNCNFPEAGDV